MRTARVAMMLHSIWIRSASDVVPVIPVKVVGSVEVKVVCIE